MSAGAALAVIPARGGSRRVPRKSIENAGEAYVDVCQLMPNCPPYEYAGVSDLRAAFGWVSLPHHRRYCQGGTEEWSHGHLNDSARRGGGPLPWDALTGGIV